MKLGLFDKRRYRFFWQRLTKGYSDNETWSLDYYLPKLILPRLKRFKQITICYPDQNGETFEDWMAILDKMIAAFEWAGSDKRWMEDQPAFVQEGIDLFAKYYFALWW